MRDMPQTSLKDNFDFILQAVQDRGIAVREQEKLAEPLDIVFLKICFCWNGLCVRNGRYGPHGRSVLCKVSAKQYQPGKTLG